MKSLSMNIIEFIESLRDEITQPEISLKKNALNKIFDFLSNLSIYDTNSDSVECLLHFYVNILDLHYDLIPIILKGLTIIIDFINFSDENAKLLALSLVKLNVPEFNPQTRHSIFELLHKLFTFNLNGLKTLDDNFLLQFISAIDGENSPDCVFLVMKLNCIVITNLKIDRVYVEYFESISNYFPIEFKMNKNTSSTLTRELIVDINKQCMIGSPLFGPQLMPLLLEKISSDRKFARIDSIDVFADGLGRMTFSDVFNYHMSFVDALLYEFQKRDPDCSPVVLRALQALIRVFEDKASEKQLLELCWHLYEVLQRIVIDNDASVLPFLHAAINGGNGRVWSGLLANFVPAIAEQLSSGDFQDNEKLVILCEILATGDGYWARYPGLVNCDKTKTFFERLRLVFDQAINIESGNTDDKRLAALFSLLGYYSLFEVPLPSSGDTQYVMESQCQLVRASLSWILVNPLKSQLQEAVVSMVHLLWRASTRHNATADNVFTDMLIGYCRADTNTLSNLSYKLLSTVPTESLLVVLRFLAYEIQDACRRDNGIQCLSSIAHRLRHESTCTDQLLCLLQAALSEFISAQTTMSSEAVTNVATVLSLLDCPSDVNVASKILDQLLSATQIHGLHQPCNVWLCTALSHWPLTTIEKSIDASELLSLLFAMLAVVSEPGHLRTCLYQTYSSLLNKTVTVRADLDLHLAQLSHDIEFLLWNLKSALLASEHDRVGVLMDILRRPDNLTNTLINGIDILYWPATPGSVTWVDETKLFPRQSMLYHQQSFQLVAQPFRDLANTDTVGSDIAMETYLKLITSYPKQIIDLSIEEIMETVNQWFSRLATMPEKLSLRLEALKVICSLPADMKCLSKYTGEIGESIAAISSALARLDAHDRLFVAKAIGWYVSAFPDYDAVKYRPVFARRLVTLIADKKRVVRVQAARSNMELL